MSTAPPVTKPLKVGWDKKRTAEAKSKIPIRILGRGDTWLMDIKVHICSDNTKKTYQKIRAMGAELTPLWFPVSSKTLLTKFTKLVCPDSDLHLPPVPTRRPTGFDHGAPGRTATHWPRSLLPWPLRTPSHDVKCQDRHRPRVAGRHSEVLAGSPKLTLLMKKDRKPKNQLTNTGIEALDFLPTKSL